MLIDDEAGVSKLKTSILQQNAGYIFCEKIDKTTGFIPRHQDAFSTPSTRHAH